MRDPGVTGPIAESVPYEDEVGGDSDASGGTGTAEIESFDASGMRFRFNPPLHPDARHVRPDLGGLNPKSTLGSVYDDTRNTYDPDFAVRKGSSRTGFESLRLGRITMDNVVLSREMIKKDRRYGFRFLYNPSQFSGTLNVGTNFIPSQQSSGTFVLQKGLEQMTFSIMLNRIPDVQSRARTSDYLPAISKNDRDQIMERGTHYDLEFLYRVANGVHNTRSRTSTGDIGVLLPNPCRLILGPYTSRGAFVSISANDQMFSGNMVPILTEVSITFSRFLNMSQKDTDDLSSYGVSREDSGSTGSEATVSATPSGRALEGKSVYQYARNAGFSPSEADIMTQIAWQESKWDARAFNGKGLDLSFGLWQINMYGDMGPDRRKHYGLSSNTALWDPATNARVARGIFLGRGKRYTDWTTYTNGSYRKVKIDWR